MIAKKHDPFVWIAPDLAEGSEDYHRHAERLQRSLVCYFAANGCAEADDLASETLLRLVEKLGEGEGAKGGAANERKQYLFGIARNVLREWRRRPAAREVELQDSDEGPQFWLPPINLISRQCLELLREAVRQNLAQLSLPEQELLHESELNPERSVTLADLAREKGAQAATMRKRAHRARIRFRKLVMASVGIADLLRCLGIEAAAV